MTELRISGARLGLYTREFLFHGVLFSMGDVGLRTPLVFRTLHGIMCHGIAFQHYMIIDIFHTSEYINSVNTRQSKNIPEMLRLHISHVHEPVQDSLSITRQRQRIPIPTPILNPHRHIHHHNQHHHTSITNQQPRQAPNNTAASPFQKRY